MRAGVAQGGIISSVLFSQYVNDMPSPFHHVELALYAINVSKSSAMLFVKTGRYVP
jgi:hypothetical protein